MAEVNATISNLTLNANRLNNPIKGDCQVEKKNLLYTVYSRHNRFKDTNRLKIKDRKSHIMQTAAIRNLEWL